MPPFPIVDTHLHLWDPKLIDYPWLEQAPLLNKPYLLEDYNEACGPVEIDLMVFVQCEVDVSQFYEEAAWVAEQAKRDARIAGMVAWAPLEKGNPVERDLEELLQHRILRGIRRIIQFEADLDFCLRPDFIKGVRTLAKYNLSFDICIDHRHLGNTIKFVKQCPDVMFILDHVGKPDIKHGVIDPWRQQLRTLAEMPNVHCKISGLTTEADHANWTREALKPYIDHALSCFGFDRLIYGGDWPVATQATSYPRWVETLDWVFTGASDDELHKLYRKNAISFYRLEQVENAGT